MLYYSGAKRALSIVLKSSTAKRPAQILQFSLEHIDSVKVINGSQVSIIPLFTDTEDYHLSHPELAEAIDKAVLNGPYSPSVFLAKGFITAKGFDTLARDLVTQEASDKKITLSADFDCTGALLDLINRRKMGQQQILSLAGGSSEDESDTDDNA